MPTLLVFLPSTIKSNLTNPIPSRGNLAYPQKGALTVYRQVLASWTTRFRTAETKMIAPATIAHEPDLSEAIPFSFIERVNQVWQAGGNISSICRE